MKKTIPLSVIADAFEAAADEWQQFYNTVTGEVVSLPDADNDFADPEEFEEISEEIDNSDDYVRLPSQRELNEYDIMERFALEKNSEVLLRALRGRKPFRTFKDCAAEYGFRQAYFAFRSAAYVDMAREWCRENGIPFTEGKKDAGGDKKSFISGLLEQRRLPALPGTREEMLRTLAEMEYGPVPPAPRRLTAEKLSETSRCAGHAVEETYRLSAQMDGFTASFPIRFVYPVSAPGKGLPLFVFINFSREAPDWYYPANEIADAGFAVASLCYLDVTDDADDGYSTGIAPDMVRVYGPTGKISLWAWACMRALDWALERGGIDPDRVAVIGHSRLGKTALWAGANDERFTHVFSNDSGCSGAALSRGNTGETIEAITRRFPHWSVDAYKAFAGKEDEAAFDQHWLLAAVAPRKLYAASASKDDWADPRGEYLSCCAASAAWERLGLTGFSHPDRLPEVGEVLREGCVGYHLREGAHYLDRWDWQRYMEFMLIKNQE